MDVYPVTATEPYRIDFFDDEVDSIRPFDPTSQRSIDRDAAPGDSSPARTGSAPGETPALAAHLREWFSTLDTDTEDGDAASPARMLRCWIPARCSRY